MIYVFQVILSEVDRCATAFHKTDQIVTHSPFNCKTRHVLAKCQCAPDFLNLGKLICVCLLLSYRKQEKIRWAKLLHFSRFSGVPRKFSREYKHLSLIALHNEHLWPRQRESISVKTLMVLKPRIYSPANLCG